MGLTLQRRTFSRETLGYRETALLQRALESCSVWCREYKNEGPKGAGEVEVCEAGLESLEMG